MNSIFPCQKELLLLILKKCLYIHCKKILQLRNIFLNFHLNQTLYRYLKETMKMAKDYKTDKNVKLIFRKICNLCFFPQEKVCQECENIVIDSRLISNLIFFINFFE